MPHVAPRGAPVSATGASTQAGLGARPHSRCDARRSGCCRSGLSSGEKSGRIRVSRLTRPFASTPGGSIVPNVNAVWLGRYLLHAENIARVRVGRYHRHVGALADRLVDWSICSGSTMPLKPAGANSEYPRVVHLTIPGYREVRVPCGPELS